MRTTATAMIGVLLVVAACGSDESAGPAVESPVGSSAMIAVTPPSDSTSPPVTATWSVAVIAVHPDLAYYGACGNETIDVDGTRYYPLYHDDVQALDAARYPIVAPVGLRGVEAARVVPPGPGDDVGTMIVYDDGLARFESESGWVIWLTTSPLTYQWEC